MMELFLEGQRVDVSEVFSSLLTLAIDDVKDFASRQTSFSKTIILPGTANNNKLFGHIFETGMSNDYSDTTENVGINFRADKSAKVLVFQDNIQAFKGTLRLLQINVDKGRPEYEAALNGEITALCVSLRGKYLTDLDFSAYDQTYNLDNIYNSWDNPGGSGIYYPLIDYGQYSDLKHDWDYKTFRPALYVKEYIDKMFAAANFRYTSALFNTSRFKSFVIPHNRKTLTKLGSANFTGSQSAPYEWFHQASGAHLEVDTTSGVGFVYEDVGDGFRFRYTPVESSTVNVSFNIDGLAHKMTTPVTRSFYVAMFFDNIEIPGTRQIYSYTANNTPFTYNIIRSLSFNQDDFIDVRGIFFSSPLDGSLSSTATVDITSAFVFLTGAAQVRLPMVLGDTLSINDTIPENIKQLDFLSSIIKLFNLYLVEDKFDERLITITPYVDFYSTDSSNADDWTYKLNRDAVSKIKPMSELNSKVYNFKYKEDSDFWNDLYKKRYNQVYGSHIYDTQFEFASNSSDVELIFAATPLVGYDGQDKVYSTIFKMSNGIEEQIDSVIRILQTKKITGVEAWSILDAGVVIGGTTTYGYAGHFNDPDSPSNDLNFGILKELFFVLVSGDLTVTQFNVYWSPYMAEITDKDSKLLTGKFYLNPRDIFNLDFSKYKVVDNVLYRLNKISDYNLTRPDECEVQLLKVINTVY